MKILKVILNEDDICKNLPICYALATGAFKYLK